MTNPSAILHRAADLIRDTAEKATDGPWVERFDAPGRIAGPYGALVCELRSPMADGRWIALMSPAVAPMIEKWLRDTASFFDEFADYWVTIPEEARDALALARAVLGEKEEQ